MFDWFKKKKVEDDPDEFMVDVKKLVGVTKVNPIMHQWPSNITAAAGGYTTTQVTTAMPAPVPANAPYFVGNIQAAQIAGVAGMNMGGVAMGAQFGGQMNPITFQIQRPTDTFCIMNGGNEIVKITKDGEVIWPDGFQINEAAEALSKSIHLSAEMQAGIRNATKQKIRDIVFEEMIAMAKEKGSLTADELTYLHQAAKIMDKLKGVI